ncbi:hypothetical protein DFO61_2371 [Ectopseudomonas oleovorans]|uniref:Uncharacterized protein n=1 Tax=Ectopseudomonas oleovorans TaxID=301 RepID=A0A397N2U6_ECTOL|nr:hypothetical protein [Pseudomonas oleovorans]RIA31646.1 hypothetical protein DFO61_2371 [Pseudomonas oleovorans]
MSIDDQNMVLALLTQAMLGAISSNFRMVVIDLDRPVWPISFFLEKDSAIDREEIEEITSTFEVGMMDVDIPCAGFKAEVFVIPVTQPLPEAPGMKVFLKREAQ